MKKGKVYGVGVGPGDPELMTLKAKRIIEENEIIVLPGQEPKETMAYLIAVQAIPEIVKKTLISAPMPMVTNTGILKEYHRMNAGKIEAFLDKGMDVVYLTIGDPTIYSTFTYLHNLLEADGYETEFISGVPSFCAAAALAHTALAEGNEPIHILPGNSVHMEYSDESGNLIIMKSGENLNVILQNLRKRGRKYYVVQDCGLDTEKIYDSTDETPEKAGYFTTIIVL